MSMDTQPLQNVVEFCLHCSVMEDSSQAIGDKRFICAHCRQAEGIYKYDAIRTAIDLHNKYEIQRNKGKKATALRRYGAAVQNLRNEGSTIREISSTLGISTTTVQKILREL